VIEKTHLRHVWKMSIQSRSNLKAYNELNIYFYALTFSANVAPGGACQSTIQCKESTCCRGFCSHCCVDSDCPSEDICIVQENLQPKLVSRDPTRLLFNQFLCTAFAPTDPKSVKRYWWLNCIFYAFGIYKRKSWA